MLKLEKGVTEVSANMRNYDECREWRTFMKIPLEQIASETNFPIDVLIRFESGSSCDEIYYDAIRAAYYHYMVLHSNSVEDEFPIMQEFIESKGLTCDYERYYDERLEELYASMEGKHKAATIGQESKYVRMRLGVSIGKLAETMSVDEGEIEEFEKLESFSSESKWHYFRSAYQLALETLSDKNGIEYWRVFEELEAPYLPDNNVMINITMMKDGRWAVYKYDDNIGKISGLQIFADVDDADDYYGILEHAA